jgi:hypothetical protein
MNTRRGRLLRAAAVLAVALVPTTLLASSHREAPAITKDPGADNTDTYAFVSPDAPNTVTLVANWSPMLEPAGGPNFYQFDENASFYIKIDNVGDAQDHIEYEFKFTTTTLNGGTFLYNTGPITSLDDPDFNVRQTYTVTRYDDGAPTVLGSGIPVPPANIGPASTPNYNALADAAVTTLSDGSKVFAGERDDPFFVDLGGVFDLLTIRKPPGDKGKGVDGVGGFNTLTIALQVPIERLTKDGLAAGAGNAIIGVYATTERPATTTLNGDGTVTTSGPSIQVSRLGQPLVNEVVIARADKDKFNASSPTDDAQFLDYVTNPEAAVLLNLLYGISVPPTPRNDLVAVFLTGVSGLNQPAGVVPAELMRLNMAIPPTALPNRLGVLAGDVAGFPNGRRLADDVTDIELRAVAGVLVPGFNVAPNNRLGDGIDTNDKPFLPAFPYVAPPNQGFAHGHHRLQQGSSAEIIDSAAAQGKVDAAAGGPSLALAGANPATTSRLEFTIPRAGHVTLTIYDVQGRAVRTLVDQPAAAGTFAAQWDGRAESGERAAAGVYFARLSTGEKTASKKIVLR